jgi:V-type H+-transporting ATPase proteolipid subunit
MSGIIAVYSLVVSVLIAEDLGPPPGTKYSLFAYVIIHTIDSFP